MKVNVYSIFDTATGLYMRPFFAESDGQALRGFKDVATDADHPVGKHPEDYTLFRIGTFDDFKGHLGFEDPQSLKTALAVVSETRQVNRDQMEILNAETSPGGTN